MVRADLAARDFHLDVERPYAVLDTAHEKNRQGSDIALRQNLVAHPGYASCWWFQTTPMKCRIFVNEAPGRARVYVSRKSVSERQRSVPR